MNLEDLRAAQTRERATDGLQDLRESFYADVAEYVRELKERRDDAAAAAEDPFGDPEVQELTDRIETAEQVAEAIYERRMGKLVKQASLAAAGMPDDEDGLTAEERDLYVDLVERIESNKTHVLDVIAGDTEFEFDGPTDDAADTAGSAGATGETAAAAAMGDGLDAESDGERSAGDIPGREGSDVEVSEPESTGTASSNADAPNTDAPNTDAPNTDHPNPVPEDAGHGSDEESTDGGTPTTDTGTSDDVARTTVRVTDDVGEILGVDERPYTLEAEDVVTLPEANAEPLVEKDAAEKLE